MLRRLFAKEAYENIDRELEKVYLLLGLEQSELKIRKQPATYFKSYSYVVEGTLNGHRFVLSLQCSALKEQTTKQQLELVIQCENPNWITLEIYAKGRVSVATKKLDMDIIDSLKGLDNIVVECNDKEFVGKNFKEDVCKKALDLSNAGGGSFKIERKRLCYNAIDLPDTTSKSQLLLQAINLGIILVQQVDN